MARLRKADRTAALATVSLFEGLSKKDMQVVERCVTELSYPTGTALVTQGETGRDAMIIVAGTADVERDGKTVDTMGPGDIVGEMSLVTKAPRSATVTSTSEVRVLLMDAREFASVLEAHPKVTIKILRTVVERLVSETAGG